MSVLYVMLYNYIHHMYHMILYVSYDIYIYSILLYDYMIVLLYI